MDEDAARDLHAKAMTKVITMKSAAHFIARSVCT
jgi:hypothetical protein